MCGCNKKRVTEHARQAAEARAERMAAAEARKLVPLGLRPEIHLPTKIARAINDMDVIIAPKGDGRPYVGEGGRKIVVVRGGHDGKLPAKMREQIVARVPGAFIEPDRSEKGNELVSEPESNLELEPEPA